MKYFVIRHGKTDANRLTRAAFGLVGAPLNAEGEQQAKDLHIRLMRMGIDLNIPVAVSRMLRTRQTASLAGFDNLVENKILNEINTPNPKLTQELVAQKKLPPQAIDAARAIIENPPLEKVWVTHGLVIAALQEILGRAPIEDFIPSFCEIRLIEINTNINT